MTGSSWPIDGLPVPAIVFDQGEARECNRAWSEAPWHRLSEAAGRRWLDAFEAFDRPALVERIATGDERSPAPVRMVDGSVRQAHVRRLRADQRSPVLLTLVPCPADAGGAVDSLTGALDGTAFHEALLTRRDAMDGACTAVLFADVDRFKHVNDRHGHVVGNAVLVAVSRRIRSVLEPGDVVARLGGDEFGIVACRPAVADLVRLGELVVDAVGQPMVVDRIELAVTISVGIALDHDPGEPGSAVVDRADRAMYRAKGAGRARSQLFDAAATAERDLLVEARSSSAHALAELERSERRVMDLWRTAMERRDHAATAALAAEAHRLRRAVGQIHQRPVIADGSQVGEPSGASTASA